MSSKTKTTVTKEEAKPALAETEKAIQVARSKHNAFLSELGMALI